MLRLSVRVLTLIVVIWTCYGDVTHDDIEISTPPFESTGNSEGPMDFFTKVNIVKKIEKIEELHFASTQPAQGDLPVQTHEIYENMAVLFSDILKLLTNPNNAYGFLEAKGLDRIVMTSISNPHVSLRKNILILLKTLFDIAPSTTNAVIPARLIDKLVDILEKDDRLDQKARVIDILYIWLPNNPTVQARIMKGKGLEPFYYQMTKLGVKDLHTMLDLFNKILKEHLDVRNNNADRIKRGELMLYERIALIEHVSRKDVCVGLLHIFSDTWVSVSRENDIVVPIIDLSMKIAPFCLKYYRGKANAIELYTSFLNFVKEVNKAEYFAKFDLNASNIEIFITDYVESLKVEPKDEF